MNEQRDKENAVREEAEKSLRLMKFAVDHASDSLFWIRPEAGFAYVNDSACRRLGYSREELLSITVFDVDPAFPREAWGKHWQEIKERKSFAIETKHRTKKGEVFPVEVSVNYVEYEGAEYNFAFARDISERKKAEAALDRERKFSSALLESMADGVVACDGEGVLTLFNRTAREWHGMDPLSLPPEKWAEHYDLFHLDGTTPLAADDVPLARAFKGEIVVDAGMSIVARGRAARFILANGSMIRDESGKKLGAVVVMRDITELRRVEEKLRRANEELESAVAARTSELETTLERLKAELEERKRIEARLQVTQFSVDNTADVVFWVRPDGSYAYANKSACSMLGYSNEEFLRLKTFDLNPDHRGKAWQKHWEELGKQGSLRFETSLIKKDGSSLLVEITANHIEFGGREFNCAFVKDITERRRAEEALETERKRMEIILSGLKTGLSLINPDMTIAWANQKIREMFPGREPVGQVCHVFYESRPTVCDGCGTLQAFKEGNVIESEQFVPASGRWYYIISQPLMDTAGRVVNVLEGISDITERKLAEKKLVHEAALNSLTTELTENILMAESIEDMAIETLKKAQQVTESRFGYVGYIDTSTGFLICPTMTHDIWDQCGVPGKSIVFEKHAGLWGWVLSNKKPLMTNDLAADSRSTGTPPGHLPITRFLSVPAFHGDFLVGQIALANAGRDYREEDLAIVERIATIFALGIRRKRAEEELHRMNDELEQRVLQRTTDIENKKSELEKANKMFVGRELRMIELKKKIKELEKKNSESRSQKTE